MKRTGLIVGAPTSALCLEGSRPADAYSAPCFIAIAALRTACAAG